MDGALPVKPAGLAVILAPPSPAVCPGMCYRNSLGVHFLSVEHSHLPFSWVVGESTLNKNVISTY